MKVTAVYFSATYTTRRIVESFVSHLTDEVSYYDITDDAVVHGGVVHSDTLFVVGVPVYAGRVPAVAAERLRRFCGSNTLAVAIAVYGNRHYDDAVLELYDILTECGFRTISAGAFIARHSIFNKIAAMRPDKSDMTIIKSFADESSHLFATRPAVIELPGNRPYKVPGGIPIWPTASRQCTSCSACARLCPVGAIDPLSPRGVDRDKCFKCGRCIVVCPTKVRRFYGIRYSLAAQRFNSMFAARREPEVWYAK